VSAAKKEQSGKPKAQPERRKYKTLPLNLVSIKKILPLQGCLIKP
jgi:hypothetical protein